MEIPVSGTFSSANNLSSDLRKVILTNAEMHVEIINIGASIYGIYLPSNLGEPVNIVLNHSDIQHYLTDEYYIGATVGRVASRINGGKLPVNEQIYQLPKNDKGQHHLHGGYKGFNKKIFDVLLQEHHPEKSMVKLRAYSYDGEEGYPGNLELTVTYTLYKNNTLTIDYEAESDRATHVNLTNHSYFNLCGNTESALNQELQINAAEILNADEYFIPTGEKFSVESTAYDFNKSAIIKDQKAKLQGAYFNDCYILSKKNTPDAVLIDPASKRKMEMSTSYPSILFYSGDYLNKPFKACDGICLEAQFFPDAPNQVDAPTLLNPGEKYVHQINLKFSW